MNSQMRRIDLCCKLFGPFFIALVDSFSTNLAILVNLGMNVASVVVEYYAIAQVWSNESWWFGPANLGRFMTKSLPYKTRRRIHTAKGGIAETRIIIQLH